MNKFAHFVAINEVESLLLVGETEVYRQSAEKVLIDPLV